jgi:glyoxylase-like metal-dependent hydrolase (beta-lactamase superfamily II)
VSGGGRCRSHEGLLPGCGESSPEARLARPGGRTLKRIAAWLLLALLALVAGAAIWAYPKLATVRSEPVADDVHVIFGFGGNVGVLATERGAVVVDTMTFRMQGERIREEAERLAGGPVQVVLNTHYHRDHTHGNPAFPAGTRVVATERTRAHLLARDAAYWEGDAAGTLPNETFADEHEIRVGGKRVRALHLGRGHTDGDLVVLFVEDRVIHLGDLLFHERYPNIDLEAGGSLRAWADTLDRVLALDAEFDRVIPGHGAPTDRAGIVRFQAFLRELWQVGEEAARAGRSLEETLRTARLETDAGFEPISVPLVFRLDRDFVVRRAWEEATARAAAR